MLAPVVLVLPVGEQALDFREGNAIIPSAVFKVIGEISKGEFLLKQVELLLGDIYLVALDVGHFANVYNLSILEAMALSDGFV